MQSIKKLQLKGWFLVHHKVTLDDQELAVKIVDWRQQHRLDKAGVFKRFGYLIRGIIGK